MRIQRDSSLSFDGSSCFSFRRASLSLSLSLSLFRHLSRFRGDRGREREEGELSANVGKRMRLASAETRTTINAVTVERGSGGGGGGIFRRAVTRTDAFRPLGATERGGLPRKRAGRSRSRVPKSIWLALAAEWSPPLPLPLQACSPISPPARFSFRSLGYGLASLETVAVVPPLTSEMSDSPCAL